MRVAWVVTGGVDAGGRDKVIPLLLSLLGRLATHHELFVFVLRYLPQPAVYPLLGATVVDLGRPEGVLRQYRTLTDALRRHGPFDVLHGYWALPAGLVAALAGHRLGVPAIVTFDSGEFSAISDIGYGAQRSWRQRAAIASAATLARRCFVTTKYQARLARSCGVDAEVMTLGAEAEWFPPALHRAEGPPWRLLHVGSINPVKDHATLLQALRLLRDRGLDVHLDVVGEDTMGGAVQTLAADLGVAERTVFHGRHVHTGLTRFYQRAHLFVLSSRHEAAATVVLEAGLSGLPVVGSNVGYIFDGAPERAEQVAPHDPQALAAAIERLLGDPVRRAAMASAARAWTSTHDAAWTVARLNEVYDRVSRGDPLTIRP